MNSTTAYPCIGPRIRVFRISMSRVPGSRSPEEGLSPISHLLNAEVVDDRRQIFVKQNSLAPAFAAHTAHPEPQEQEVGEVDGKKERDAGGRGDHHRDD